VLKVEGQWGRVVRLFIAGMLLLNLLFFLHFREGIKLGHPDFTVFYTAGTILRQGLGHQLYSKKLQYEVQQPYAGHIAFRRGPLPYIHPPFEATIFVPLSRLPYQWAFAVWDLASVAALFGVAELLRRSAPSLRLIAPWKLAVGSIAFFPVFACLLEGQDSILLLLLCTLAFYALKRELDLLGGCWLALAAFKFQFIIPIVLLFIIWKRRRIALGFVAVGSVLVLASVGLVGLEGLLQYPKYVLQVVNTPSLGGVPPQLLPNLHGLSMALPEIFSGVGRIVVAALSSVVLFLFAAWKGRSSGRPRELELQFSLAIVVSGLIAWQTNSHDLSLLVLPLGFTTVCYLEGTARARRFASLLPLLPLLISPLWMTLWLVIGKVNLMAIPLLWWTFEISKELSFDPPNGLAVCHKQCAS
jgi:hypothetical protein